MIVLHRKLFSLNSHSELSDGCEVALFQNGYDAKKITQDWARMILRPALLGDRSQRPAIGTATQTQSQDADPAPERR